MSSLQSIHILLVDDNQHMRAITSAILQSAGIRKIREVADGSAALDALRTLRSARVVREPKTRLKRFGQFIETGHALR